jgi:hypothetical protein
VRALRYRRRRDEGFDHINVNINININIFIPDDFTAFGASLIKEGTNFSLHIGHTVFRVSELVDEWSNIEAGLNADATLASPPIRIASTLASLLRLDRVAWFLVARKKSTGSASLEQSVVA